MTLRVALVASSPTSGGAEEYLYRLYSSLRKNFDTRVTLIGSLPSWPNDLGPRRPVPTNVKLTRRSPSYQQAGAALRSAYEINEAIDDSFDLVHMQYFHPKLMLTSYIQRRLPVLWTEHGPVPPNLGKVGKALFRHQARKVRIVAVSAAVGQSLREIGLHSVVVPNPLPHRSTITTPGTDVSTVLYAGRLHQAKRVELLVEAARIMPQTRFVVAGDGPVIGFLKSVAPPNVSFLGHVSDVASLMNVASCVVIPSGKEAREGSPMTMLEARARGVPVVMADDCHAAAEARSLGCHLFSPTPVHLSQVISALGPSTRESLTEEVREQRSEAAWSSAHHAIMASMASSRRF